MGIIQNLFNNNNTEEITFTSWIKLLCVCSCHSSKDAGSELPLACRDERRSWEGDHHPSMPYISPSRSFCRHLLNSPKPSCFACVVRSEQPQQFTPKEQQYFTQLRPSEVTRAETWTLCHPTHILLLYFFFMLHIYSFNQTPFPFAEAQYSVFNISNSCLWEQKL